MNCRGIKSLSVSPSSLVLYNVTNTNRYSRQAIAVSGTIGLGLFVDSGLDLEIAGPGGALLGVGLIGLTAIAVMDGIAEMVGLWPISNAFVEFVDAFVDQDLAKVVGVAYWEASSTFDRYGSLPV